MLACVPFAEEFADWWAHHPACCESIFHDVLDQIATKRESQAYAARQLLNQQGDAHLNFHSVMA